MRSTTSLSKLNKFFCRDGTTSLPPHLVAKSETDTKCENSHGFCSTEAAQWMADTVQIWYLGYLCDASMETALRWVLIYLLASRLHGLRNCFQIQFHKDYMHTFSELNLQQWCAKRSVTHELCYFEEVEIQSSGNSEMPEILECSH